MTEPAVAITLLSVAVAVLSLTTAVGMLLVPLVAWKLFRQEGAIAELRKDVEALDKVMEGLGEVVTGGVRRLQP